MSTLNNRLAILPFQTNSETSNSLGQAVYETIFSVITSSPSYEVISKDSSSQYLATHDLGYIFKSLHCSIVLTGYLSERENEFELILTLYSKKNKKAREQKSIIDKKDILHLGDICLNMVHQVLGLTNSKNVQEVPKLQNPQLYRKFILANYHFNRWTKNNIVEAVQLYKEVITKEPQFVPAYLKLAKSYMYQAGRGYEKPMTVYPLAMRAIETALKINPNSGEAIIDQNLINFFFHLDWRYIYTSIEKGLENYVDASEAYQQLSFFWYGLREYDAALDALYSALEYDPISTGILNMIGDVQLSARRYDASEKTFKSILKMVPNDTSSLENLLYIAALRNSKQRCFYYLNKLKKLLPEEEKYVPRMAYAYGKFGMVKEAHDYLDYYNELEKKNPNRVIHNFKAQVYSGLGNWDKAMSLIEKGWEARTGLLFILTDPQWEPIRKWKRYQALVGQIQFPSKVENVHYITLQTDLKETLRINLNSLLFAKAEDNYTRLFFYQNFRIEQKLIRATLQKVTIQLPPTQFIRIHKSTVLNTEQRFSISGNSKTRIVRLIQYDYELTVSRSLSNELLKLLYTKAE